MRNPPYIDLSSITLCSISAKTNKPVWVACEFHCTVHLMIQKQSHVCLSHEMIVTDKGKAKSPTNIEAFLGVPVVLAHGILVYGQKRSQ